MKIIFFTDESVKRQITDSISENLTDLDLESRDFRKKKFCREIDGIKTFVYTDI